MANYNQPNGIVQNGGTFTNQDNVQATADNAILTGAIADTTVDNNAGGQIVGQLSGVIQIQSGGTGALTVSNAGLIQGIDYDGVTQHGTGALNVTNTSTGIIYGQNATGSQNGYGVGSDGRGELTLINQTGGTIVGQYGVVGSSTTDQIINAGTIAAGSYAAGTGGNPGTVTPGGIAGIELRAGGTVTNQFGGVIDSGGRGVSLGAAGTIDNQFGGIIRHTGTADNGVGNGAGIYANGDLTLTNVGVVTTAAGGANDGVTVLGIATITNTGSRDGSGNLTGGLIQAANASAIAIVGAGSSVTNSGTIQGGNDPNYGYGVALNNGGTINNQTGGLIAGSLGGINSGGGATITNAGTISATSSGQAILLNAGGTITNEAGGLIQGGDRGITSNAALTLTNLDAISGTSDGIGVTGGASSILNAGTIRSSTNYGVAAGGNGATLSVTNAASGTIAGGSDTTNGFGLGSNGQALAVNNYGSIGGTAGGITALNNLALTANFYAGSTTGSILGSGGDDTVSLYTGTGTNGTGATTSVPVSGQSVVLQAAGTNAAATVDAIALGGGTNTLNLRGTGDGTASNGASGTLDISTVSGLTALNKQDAGTFVLTGSYNGALVTTVTGGRVIAQDTGSAFGTSGTVSISSGATVELNATVNTYYTQAPNTFTGAGTIEKTGSGAFTFGGNGGDTNISLLQGGLINVLEGTLGGSSFGQGIWTNNQGSLNVAAGATFNTVEAAVFIDALTGDGTYAGGYAGTRTTTIGVAGGSGIFAGTLQDNSGSGALAIVKTGAGTQTFSGNNTYSGGTEFAGGFLNAGSAAALGTTGTLSFTGGTLQYSAANQIDYSDRFSTNAGQLYSIDTNGQAVTFATALTSSGGSLSKLGAGVLTLTGANTYSGATTISAGTLALTGTGSIDQSERVIDNATFDISGSTSVDGNNNSLTAIQSLGGNTAGATVVLGTQTLTITNATDTFAGTINGTGGITLTGGAETLTGTNGYQGVTTIAGGTLALAGAGSIVASSGVVANGTFDISGVTATAGVAITTLSGGGSLALGGNALALTAAAGTFSGAITGTVASSLTLQAGTEVLDHANTGFAGAVNLIAGTLELANIQGAGTGAITFATGAQTLRLDTAGTLANTIASFATDDIIDLRAVTYAGATLSVTGNTVTVTESAANGGDVNVLNLSATPSGFQYVLSNDGFGSTALKLQAIPAPPAPSGSASSGPTAINDTASATFGTVLKAAAPGVLANDSGLGATKTVSALNGQTAAIGKAVAGAYGSLTLNGDGSYSYISDATKTIFTTSVVDHFTYTDTANGQAATASLDITVSAPSASTLALFGNVVTNSASQTGSVYALYEGLLGRAPDALGLEGFSASLQAGAKLTDVAAAILGSAERGGLVSDPNAYVQALYTNTLHRAPDSAGQQFYVTELNSGVSQATVAVQFASSTEAAQVNARAFSTGVFVTDAIDAAVTRLYYGLLDRSPDATGLGGFETQVKQAAATGGVNGAIQGLANVANVMLGSQEYAAAHAGQSNAAFVDSLFVGTLGRHADAGGSAFYTNELSQGVSKAQVALQIAQSQEAQVHLVGQIELGWHLA